MNYTQNDVKGVDAAGDVQNGAGSCCMAALGVGKLLV